MLASVCVYTDTCVCVHNHIKELFPPELTAVADLPGQPYVLPSALPTDLRLDIVVHSSEHIHMFELIVF